MKNLEKDVILQEMSLRDMKEVNGGVIGLILGGFATFILWDIAMNPSDALEQLKAGYNS